MTRIAAIVVVLAMFAVGGWLAGRAYDRADDVQAEVDTRQRIEDALDRIDGCAWRERLRGDC
jgi:hypothetical protein